MEIVLNSPLDMHLHLREKEMLTTVAPYTAKYFAGAVIMPNLITPVDSKEKMMAYRDEIKAACKKNLFTPYMTLFFKPYSEMNCWQSKRKSSALNSTPQE